MIVEKQMQRVAAWTSKTLGDFVRSEFVTPKEFAVHMEKVGMVRIILKDADQVKTVYWEGERQ